MVYESSDHCSVMENKGLIGKIHRIPLGKSYVNKAYLP